MDIKSHTIKNFRVAEIVSDQIIINSTTDGLNLLGDLYYQGFDSIVLHEKNITPAFFKLSNGMAGEILQKFSNYRVRLAIVGDFAAYNSSSLKQFIIESNKNGHINFVTSITEALQKLGSV